MSSIKREAIRDAHEYAMAKMFYGEGAGIRRRLINQTVQFKIANVPGYDVAFQKELATQDFAKISRKARRERRLIDAKDVVNRNGKALARGDFRSLSLPILVVAGGAIVAHQTGYDKKAFEYSKKEYRKVKLWAADKRHQWEHRHDSKVHELGPSGPITAN
jgi:hypothetical protein